MLNGLDLFSGIGGISLALAPWVRPVAYCEIERYPQAVLLSKMAEGKLPLAPIWDDVRTLNRGILAGHNRGSHDDGETIDIITGGFPCQDISVAGNGLGLAGERSGLFFQIARLAGELRPSFIFLENVPAITTRGGIEVVRTFTEMGYDSRWCVISAQQVGAPHKRDRWFYLAHTDNRHEQPKPEIQTRGNASFVGGQAFSDAKFNRRKGRYSENEYRHTASAIMSSAWWAIEPDVGRVVYGIPQRVDRIKSLGNAVVPAQARAAFKMLMGLEKETN